jgi:hypothetical protein
MTVQPLLSQALPHSTNRTLQTRLKRPECTDVRIPLAVATAGSRCVGSGSAVGDIDTTRAASAIARSAGAVVAESAVCFARPARYCRQQAAQRVGDRRRSRFRNHSKRVGGQVAHDARVAGEATSCASGEDRGSWRSLAPGLLCGRYGTWLLGARAAFAIGGAAAARAGDRVPGFVPKRCL